MGYAFKHRKKIKLNNRGSALVTVIVAAVFLSAIVTILLFVTAKNYKARQTNYKTMKNFYEAEKTLDEFKTVVIKDCSDCCSKAYLSVLKNYINLSSLDRQRVYNESFIECAMDIWATRTNGVAMSDAVKNTLEDSVKNNIESVGSLEINNEENFLKIKDIVVSCSTIEGCYARIKADIKIEIPQFDWGNGSSNDAVKEIIMEDYVVYSDWQRD